MAFTASNGFFSESGEIYKFEVSVDPVSGFADYALILPSGERLLLKPAAEPRTTNRPSVDAETPLPLEIS